MIIITLYTSRVILQTLGVMDYGVFTVVGGVILLLSFLNNSLTTATQRFLNYEMGLENRGNVKEMFSTAIICYIIITIILIFISETAGLWFVKNHLVIPPERMTAAIRIYHFSVAMMVIVIITTPYVALILAQEKMDVYAYISIIDACLKLLIVFVLQAFSCDKLIMYGLLLLFVTALINGSYVIYCRIKFQEFQFIFTWSKNRMKKLLGFSGWMIAGTSSDILSGQGVNMLINIFFGPIYNAARGITDQVQSGFESLVSNIMKAFRPQIVQSYSKEDFVYMYKLVFISSKFSFFLLYSISLPILFQTDYLLSLWLKEVPDYTVIFVQLMIIDMLIKSSFNSIASVSQASGKIKKFQIIILICNLFVFFISFLFYKMKYPIYTTYIIVIIISLLGFFARLFELKITLNFPVGKFLTEVTGRIFFVTILSIILPVIFSKFTNPSFIGFCEMTLLCLIPTIIISWFVGIDKFEKEYLLRLRQRLRQG